MAFAFKKAVKSRQKLRLSIEGISGSGKTYSALAIASGMSSKVAVIDSEHGSASLYADRFSFDALELDSFQIEDYISALNMAGEAGYEVVIIDSTSHAWDTLVERVERLAGQRFGGNTFRAWGEGTPLQKKLVEAMLSYPGHLIATCRSKTEYAVDKTDKGKTEIRKVGTAAVQRQGFEYEFTIAMTVDANHTALVTKDRTGKFQDKFIERPGIEFGKALLEWLSEGAAPDAAPDAAPIPNAAAQSAEPVDKPKPQPTFAPVHTKKPDSEPVSAREKALWDEFSAAMQFGESVLTEDFKKNARAFYASTKKEKSAFIREGLLTKQLASIKEAMSAEDQADVQITEAQRGLLAERMRSGTATAQSSAAFEDDDIF